MCVCHDSDAFHVVLVLQGMQRNPPYPTIEAELESAMHKAGAISDLNANSFHKVMHTDMAAYNADQSLSCYGHAVLTPLRSTCQHTLRTELRSTLRLIVHASCRL